MLDSEAIKERINGGHYSSGVNARRAIGQLKISKREKKVLYQLVDEKLPAVKEVRKKGSKVRKRRSDGSVLNGAGDSRTVTLFKLAEHRDALGLVAHLLAKAVDEHTTLPELHEEVQSIAKLLKL